MVVARYPATAGHTNVINNLCHGLNKLGYNAAIGAFSFDSNPPFNIEKVKLSKRKLLTSGVSYLNYDIIHPHQSRVLYYLLSVKPTKPVVLHYHGASDKIQEKNFKLAMRLYKNRITKIISVSKAGITQMNKMVNGLSADVVYNGVNTEFFKPNLSQQYKKGEPELLFVSALRRYKKSTILVNALPSLLKKYPNAHLQIVGDGEDYKKLEEIILEKNLENKVELTGRIKDDELKLRYSSCDLYISASTFEVCPVPTLEAMACGKPLVLYSIQPHDEVIENSKAGLTFNSMEPEEICKKVIQAYKNKNQFSEAALSYSKNLDWKKICNQISHIYQKVCS